MHPLDFPSLQAAFSEIIAERKFNVRSDAAVKNKKIKKAAQAQAQKAEYFVPYAPVDYHSEQA